VPNSSYVKGRRKEYAAIRLLERSGHLAFRTAGSHSPFDVIALTSSVVRLIQLKAEYLSAVDREALEQIRVPSNVTKESWRWPDRHDPIITVIP
jgi:Holliday junction resolvase